MSDKDNTEELDDTLLNDNEADKAEAQIGNAEDEAPELSAEQILQDDLAKEKDKFLRLFAEFENYKKRTSKERMELFKTAGQEVIVSLLPVIDDFDRALLELSKSDDKETTKGIQLISGKLMDTLKSKGLEELEVRAGDTFNADFHEAITQIPAPSEEMKGKIIDVIEKGFKLGDKIIRHPKVVVGN